MLGLPRFGKTIISGGRSQRVAVGLQCLSDWRQSAWRWRGGWANCLLPLTTSTTLSVPHWFCLAPPPDLHKTECTERVLLKRDRNYLHLLSWYLLRKRKEQSPDVLLKNFERWWGIHDGTFSEHEPESKLYQSQRALISLIGVKPAVWKGPVRLGPNQTWGIRSDSLSSGPKQTETEKMPRWSTRCRAERKHI